MIYALTVIVGLACGMLVVLAWYRNRWAGLLVGIAIIVVVTVLVLWTALPPVPVYPLMAISIGIGNVVTREIVHRRTKSSPGK